MHKRIFIVDVEQNQKGAAGTIANLAYCINIVIHKVSAAPLPFYNWHPKAIMDGDSFHQRADHNIKDNLKYALNIYKNMKKKLPRSKGGWQYKT